MIVVVRVLLMGLVYRRVGKMVVEWCLRFLLHLILLRMMSIFILVVVLRVCIVSIVCCLLLIATMLSMMMLVVDIHILII